jgi:hypothetical protein
MRKLRLDHSQTQAQLKALGIHPRRKVLGAGGRGGRICEVYGGQADERRSCMLKAELRDLSICFLLLKLFCKFMSPTQAFSFFFGSTGV